ncbi:cytochrome c peroxidase [Limibacter armeniacum]|uniref:cytochrome-c peroxidase n=1 Tax=Limibacter armeniacum TaxID=466084 RepID=UPI002FE5C411
MGNTNFLSVLVCLIIGLWSCTATPELSPPAPERNPTTSAGIALGKQLFFDPLLSANRKVSCATCHQPDKAFTDGVSLSTAGVTGNQLLRHAPTLMYIGWSEKLFWDGGANDLESQAFGPLTHHDEMGIDLKELTKRLNEDAGYRQQFQDLFGIDSVQSAYVARALAQYQRSLYLFSSQYDAVKKGKAAFSEEELRGEKVFIRHCERCHRLPLFTDFRYHNNGLDTLYSSAHEGMAQGRYRITLDSADMGRYKTPTLRNITLTAPYMHDGRFATLDDVLEFYQQGINQTVYLDTLLLMSKKEERFSDEEQQALKVFLQTLTDDFTE